MKMEQCSETSVYKMQTPMKMEQCSETSAYKMQTPGNHPKERTQTKKILMYLQSDYMLRVHILTVEKG